MPITYFIKKPYCRVETLGWCLQSASSRSPTITNFGGSRSHLPPRWLEFIPRGLTCPFPFKMENFPGFRLCQNRTIGWGPFDQRDEVLWHQLRRQRLQAKWECTKKSLRVGYFHFNFHCWRIYSNYHSKSIMQLLKVDRWRMQWNRGFGGKCLFQWKALNSRWGKIFFHDAVFLWSGFCHRGIPVFFNMHQFGLLWRILPPVLGWGLQLSRGAKTRRYTFTFDNLSRIQLAFHKVSFSVEAPKVVSFGPVVRYAADLKILFRAMPFKSPLFKNLKVNEEVSLWSNPETNAKSNLHLKKMKSIPLANMKIKILGQNRRTQLLLPFSPCNVSVVTGCKFDNYSTKRVLSPWQTMLSDHWQK